MVLQALDSRRAAAAWRQLPGGFLEGEDGTGSEQLARLNFMLHDDMGSIFTLIVV
jgi:hypothetical protein